MPDVQKLLSAIDSAEAAAYGGSSNSDLSEDRALALDYYHGRNVEPAPDGRSQVTDRSVFETIQWILPSLCRIFANGDNVVAFTPLGEEDEQASEQEADYLNYVVTQRNPWFQIALEWFHDALLSKNGYCLPYIEEVLKTETETYENQSEESVALLTQGEGVEVLSFQSFPDPSGEQVPVIDPMTGPVIIGVDPMGNPIPMMQPKMLHSLTIRHSKPEKKLCFKVLPPERCLVDENCTSFSLAECNYFEFWDMVTITSLRALGFEVADDITDDSSEAFDSEDFSRNLYSEELPDEGESLDPAMRRVKARMVWIRHDYDEDGISELQMVFRVGQQILTKQGQPFIYHVSRIPVSCITPMPNPHRHVGTSEADIVGDLQRIKTAILRQGLDSLYLANNPRHIVSNQVNLDDMQISRPGGLVRMVENSSAIPAEGHAVPIVTPFVFPQAIEGMEYMDQIRENRTGTNRYFTGVDQNALNKTATGVQALSTMAAQRVEQIARVFASGVEYLFSVAHELLLKSGIEKDVIKLRGKWVQIDPSTWKTGRDMRICVGYGAGNKDALIGRLGMILQAQAQSREQGLRVASEQNTYEALIELTKASDFSAPGRFWTDPTTLPPPQPIPSEHEIYAAVEGQKIASSERTDFAQIQSNERIKVADLTQKNQSDQLEAEVRLIIEQMKQGGGIDLEKVKAHFRDAPIRVETEKIDNASKVLEQLVNLNQQQTQHFSELGKRLENLVTQLNAPKRIIRGKDGRAEGVEAVNGSAKRN